MAKTIERTFVEYDYILGTVTMKDGAFSTTVTRTVQSEEKLSARRQKALCNNGERVLAEQEREILYRATVEDFKKIATVVDVEKENAEKAARSANGKVKKDSTENNPA